MESISLDERWLKRSCVSRYSLIGRARFGRKVILHSPSSHSKSGKHRDSTASLAISGRACLDKFAARLRCRQSSLWKNAASRLCRSHVRFHRLTGFASWEMRVPCRGVLETRHRPQGARPSLRLCQSAASSIVAEWRSRESV
jgi:hypothetical protein